MYRYKCAILQNESDDAHEHWVIACKKNNIGYQVVNIFQSNWLESCRNSKFDFFLACPPGLTQLYKTVYDERIRILSKEMKLKVFPSCEEIELHENKRYLAVWLELRKINHPKTYVFFQRSEALKFVEEIELPLVTKTNIGASGSGVEIHRDKISLAKYINKAFTSGIRKKSGPNLRMGGLIRRVNRAIKSTGYITKRLSNYKSVAKDVQRDFVILQQFIPHDFEWRVVRIGSSYFGHKKMKTGDKASGTKGIIYDLPPDSLLNFVQKICEDNKLFSVAIDVFEYPDQTYLVNEIQTIFGHVQSFICANAGEPGRLINLGGKWRFEPGLFNDNLTYDLRLSEFISTLSN